MSQSRRHFVNFIPYTCEIFVITNNRIWKNYIAALGKAALCKTRDNSVQPLIKETLNKKIKST